MTLYASLHIFICSDPGAPWSITYSVEASSMSYLAYYMHDSHGVLRSSGGFQIQNLDAEKGYIYVQFESLKRGYIDDVEFLVTLGL